VSLEANKAISAYHPSAIVYAGTSDIMAYRNMRLGYALVPVLTDATSVIDIQHHIFLTVDDKIMLCEEKEGKLTYTIL
jgi:hypothetical protein